MKKTLLLSICCMIFFVSAKGQISLEAQIGGSNFLGATINASYDILLNKQKHQFLTPSLGIGVLPFPEDPKLIVHVGLNYKISRWGLGTEVSRFLDAPSWASGYNNFIDLLVYPNANYTLPIKRNSYLRISAGAYFAFLKIGSEGAQAAGLNFAGDVIPGAGLAAGYKF